MAIITHSFVGTLFARTGLIVVCELCYINLTLKVSILFERADAIISENRQAVS